jgi:hypothetical protein
VMSLSCDYILYHVLFIFDSYQSDIFLTYLDIYFSLLVSIP